MARLPVRLLLAAALAAAAASSGAAQEASPDTARSGAPAPRAETTVPLPNGRGVFYYRSGTPGGIRVRSRSGRRADSAAVRPPPSPVSPLPPPDRPRSAPAESVSRLDLLLLEQSLLDAIDRRLDALDALDVGRRSRTPSAGLPPQTPGPVLVVPSPAAPISPAEPTPRGLPDAVPRPPTPVLPTPAPPPGGVTVEEVERSILETGLFRTTAVHFEFDRSALLPVSERTLDVVAAVLRDYPALRFEIGGHTDAVGSESYNDALSQRRAEAVLDALVVRGVDRARLAAVGFGERQPVATNGNATGRALNRRVEFTVLNPEAAETIRRTRETEGAGAIRDLIREEIERARRDDG